MTILLSLAPGDCSAEQAPDAFSAIPEAMELHASAGAG